LNPVSIAGIRLNKPAARSIWIRMCRQRSTTQLRTTGSCSPGADVSQFPVRARCRAVVLEIIPGTVSMPNHGGDCAVEIGNRDGCMEDANGDSVPSVFSFGPHPVCWAIR